MPKPIADAIERAQTILLTTTELDGDAVGAIVGLALTIEQLWPKKRVVCVTHEILPNRYRCIVPDESLFVVATEAEPRPMDLSIVLDGDPDRLRTASPHYRAAQVIGMIDHHKSSAAVTCDVMLHDAGAASTTELILRLCDHWGAVVDKDIAQAIYAGLVFDTSIFRYGHTAPGTLRMAARLIETGFDHRRVVEKVLLEQDADKVRLKGRMIERMKLRFGGQYAWSALTAAEVSNAETGGLVDDLVFVAGVEVGALLVEKDDGRIKVSLRSRGGVDVSDVAQRCAITGGGHPRAAGVMLNGGLDDVSERLSSKIEEFLA